MDLLVIGHGFAGQRFTRAVDSIRDLVPAPLTLAVTDRDPGRLASVPLGWRVIPPRRSFPDPNSGFNPDVVVVAVNESQHFDVLRALPPSTRGVLCEKPLTATLAEAIALRPILAGLTVSINLVERHSPVVAAFREWMAERPYLSPTRAEFFWGKDRVGDPRPTIGVAAEVVHPLDLVDHLIGLDEWTVLSAAGTVSDFAPNSPGQIDSVDLRIQTPKYHLIGHSSFVWPSRHRSLTITLHGGSGASYRAVFTFDEPRWDCDRLAIYRLESAAGQKALVWSRSVSADDFPGRPEQLAKVSEFLRTGLTAVATGSSPDVLVGYAQALKLQRLLDDIESAIPEVASDRRDPLPVEVI